ncbi:MAG: hypothetical protein ABI777_01930 [Betaproteobacteria bacterium]
MHRLLLVLLWVGISSAAAQTPTPADRFVYEDLAASAGIPVSEYTLLGAVLAGDQPKVRRHAWDIWAALTAPSASIVDGQRLPVFATWFSIDEVYNPRGSAGVGRRVLRHPFKPATQGVLAGTARGGAPAGLMSFVKLNRASADFIWSNDYYLTPALRALNTKFDRDGTAPVERSIKPFPAAAISLKLVYWLVKAANSPQSERGLTALPIWNPAYPPPPDGGVPMHTTWTNAVAVDPSDRYAEGSLQQVNVNGTVANANRTWAPVVSLRRFHSHRLTNPEDVADARAYMAMMSSAAGEQERLVTNAGQIPEVGDYVVLLAMHVTTKELDDWTFQTFWWMPSPHTAPFGDDRPATVRAPFDNYQMCTAYSVVSPRGANGSLPICFNPYLETDLGPTKPYTMDGKSFPPDPMAGTRSNCQNCHRRAAFPAFDSKAPASADFGHVANDGYRSPNDAYFAPLLKTDFVWSIALKNVTP